MKIALIGYGKMGKEIEAIALLKGHSIVLKADSKTNLNSAALKSADVAIEFTSPQAAVNNIEICLEAGIPVVVGSTGWYKELDKVKASCKEKNGAMLYATNFSVGVNLFFAANAFLAQKMNAYSDYDVDIHEIHHTQKLDAPSGTAITTAETVLKNLKRKNKWVHGEVKQPTDLLITHERVNNVPGTHVVKYSSEIDQIEISHIAHNRQGFASGAVLAAEWLKGKKGVFTMKDVLGIEF